MTAGPCGCQSMVTRLGMSQLLLVPNEAVHSKFPRTRRSQGRHRELKMDSGAQGPGGGIFPALTVWNNTFPSSPSGLEGADVVRGLGVHPDVLTTRGWGSSQESLMSLSPLCDQSVPKFLRDRVQVDQETRSQPIRTLTELSGVPRLSALSQHVPAPGVISSVPACLRTGDLSLLSLGEAIQGHLSPLSMDGLTQGHLSLVSLAVLTQGIDPGCPWVSLLWDIDPWGS